METWRADRRSRNHLVPSTDIKSADLDNQPYAIRIVETAGYLVLMEFDLSGKSWLRYIVLKHMLYSHVTS